MTPALRTLSWPFATARTVLRPMRFDDCEAAWRYRRLEEVTTWTGTWLESFEQWQLKVEQRLGNMLVAERDGEILGDFMIKIGDGWAQDAARRIDTASTEAELGWTVSPRFAGRGLGTEIAGALLEICFERLQLRRVTARAFADNGPSIRIMDRIGMRREQYSVEDSLHARRGWLDGVAYAMLAREYRALIR